jgi:hypothetical protein
MGNMPPQHEEQPVVVKQVDASDTMLWIIFDISLRLNHPISVKFLRSMKAYTAENSY